MVVKMKVRDVGNFIREQRSQAGVSLRKLAKLAGVSNPYLSQIERGLRRPSAEILNGIAKALRISAETLYVQAGILDDRKDHQDLTEAILADRTLTERQKQVLVQVYRSFKEDTERQREARRRRRSSRKPAPPGSGKLGGRVESAG
ncbi:MAG TPA: helix-turn-helix transcriptional regulator [Actinomycetota bacterium]|nr:helix-turn-helix transcriptional regulator [Actinomycetota bacterium]